MNSLIDKVQNQYQYANFLTNRLDCLYETDDSHWKKCPNSINILFVYLIRCRTQVKQGATINAAVLLFLARHNETHMFGFDSIAHNFQRKHKNLWQNLPGETMENMKITCNLSSGYMIKVGHHENNVLSYQQGWIRK